jgi:hypothetical protein
MLQMARLSYAAQRKQTPWPQSASELYRPSDRRMSVKLVPTFSDRGCRVISTTDPHCRILTFLLLFLSSSSSIVLTMLNGPRYRPITSQKIW